MNGTLPVSVRIGAQLLKAYAVGDSIEARFRAVIQPEHLRDGCYMCSNEDEEFRAAVGGLLLSYETGSPEQARITAEMVQLQRVSTVLRAVQQGITIGDVPEPPDGFEAIGLLRLWRERERSP